MSGHYIVSPPANNSSPMADEDDFDMTDRPQFIKTLYLREHLQDVIRPISAVVSDELQMGQQELLIARGLAIAANWNCVIVNQMAIDLVTHLKGMLTSESSVRLKQTATAINPDATQMSSNALFVQLNPGLCKVADFLTVEDDSAVIIPLIIPEGQQVTAWDRRNPADKLDLPMTPSFGYLLNGRSYVHVNGTRPLTCLVFSMAGHSVRYPTYCIDTMIDLHEGMRIYRALGKIPIKWKTKADKAKSLYYEFL